MLIAVLSGFFFDLASWILFDHAFLRLGLLIFIRNRSELLNPSYQSFFSVTALFVFYFLLHGFGFLTLSFLSLLIITLFSIAHRLHQHYYVVELLLGFIFLVVDLGWWQLLIRKTGIINEFTFYIISVNLLLLCGIQGRLGNRLAEYVKRKVRTPNRIDSL